MRGNTPVVVLTVDTEEDEWGRYDLRSPGTDNVRALPAFQRLCEAYGAAPTYLCNWPVVTNEQSAAVIRELSGSRACEIGTHIHPWNTPPVDEETGPRTSMLCNLPAQLIRSKLTAMHRQIEERLGLTPTCFRAGRWAGSGDVARVLEDLGYHVDSSVAPYVDWSSDFGPDYRRAPAKAYRFSADAPLTPDPNGALVEVPATIGFLRGRPQTRMRLRAWALRPLPRRLRMVGIFDRLRLATLRWLSPEVSTGAEMIQLAETLVGAGATCLNLTFHSPTLEPGLTPFVKSAGDRTAFVARIEAFLSYARDAGYRFLTLSEVPRWTGLEK